MIYPTKPDDVAARHAAWLIDNWAYDHPDDQPRRHHDCACFQCDRLKKWLGQQRPVSSEDKPALAPPRDVDGTCSDDAKAAFEEAYGITFWGGDDPTYQQVRGYGRRQGKSFPGFDPSREDDMGIHPSAQRAARQTTWIWYAGIVLTVATVAWLLLGGW